MWDSIELIPIHAFCVIACRFGPLNSLRTGSARQSSASSLHYLSIASFLAMTTEQENHVPLEKTWGHLDL